MDALFKQPKTKIKQALAEIAFVKETLRVAETQLNSVLGETKIQCVQNNYGEGCNRWHQVNALTYIQTHYYIPPSGCTGGDYWNNGEGQWYCPKCNHRNRLHNMSEVQKIKKSFKNIDPIAVSI